MKDFKIYSAMETKSPSRVTLTKLPYDILHQIFTLASPETRTRVFNLEHPFLPETLDWNPLVPLSMTCKAIRAQSSPFLFRLVNISNRRGCARRINKMVDQLKWILEFDKVLDNIHVMRFYYVGHPEFPEKVVAGRDKELIEDEDLILSLTVQLFQRISSNLQKLRFNIEPPSTDAKFKEAFMAAEIRLTKLRELRVGDSSDWLIKSCPNVDTVTQVQYNGNLPGGFSGRKWNHGSDELLENIKAASKLRMLWVWGTFDGKGLDDLVAAAPKLNHIGFISKWSKPYVELSEHLLPLAPTLEHLSFFIIQTQPLNRTDFTLHFAKLFPRLKHIWFASSYNVEIFRAYSIVGDDGKAIENITLKFTNTESNQVDWKYGKFDELITRRY